MKFLISVFPVVLSKKQEWSSSWTLEVLWLGKVRTITVYK